MLSVIIPTYNSAATIEKNLTAFYTQKGIGNNDFEVIIVDDSSTDNTVNLVKKFPARLVTLSKNSGPATARNLGAKEAKGETILFIDSDVILKDDALNKVKEKFSEYSEIGGLIGIYAKEPANRGLFREYLALKKYSNWFDPKQKFTSVWIVSIGAIKKDIFLEYGGFDTRYRGADVEDFELGYRISEKYKILLADDIQGYHYFSGFAKTLGNFFRRSYQWTALYFARKKFSTEAATTKKRGLGNLAGFFSLVVFVLSFWKGVFLPFAILASFIFIFSNLNFYRFVLKEKNIPFLLYAIVLDYICCAVVTTAAILSILNQWRLNVISR